MRKREGEREKNIDVREIHVLVASHMPTTGDVARKPGMGPDLESNWQSLGSQSGTNPLGHTSQGTKNLCGTKKIPNSLSKFEKEEPTWRDHNT